MSNSEPVRADQVENVDHRNEDQQARDNRTRKATKAKIRRTAIKRVGGDTASSPDLAADLEARLKRAEKRVK